MRTRRQDVESFKVPFQGVAVGQDAKPEAEARMLENR
jgi:formyltetrahydrofolate hydrolase